MALKTANFTLSGSAQPLATETTPVTLLIIESATSNADVKIGDNTLTATIYGMTLEDGPTARITLGPWGGGTSPINLQHIYVLGTGSQIIHLTYVPL